MKLLNRYIAINIMTSTAMVMAVMLGVVVFVKLMGQFNHMDNTHYGVWKALQHVGLLLPKYQYMLLPMVCLLGSLLGLGGLASHHELEAMRAAGMSIQQITKAVLQGALVIIVISMMLGEGVAPFSAKHASKLKLIAMSAGQAMPSAQGIWVRDGNMFIKANQVLGSHELRGILRYHFGPGQRLQKVDFAKRGVFTGGQWQLFDIEETVFDKDGKVQIAHHDKLLWQVHLAPKILSLSKIKSDDQSLWQLMIGIYYGRDHGVHTAKLQYHLWKRLTVPFASIVMIFLGVPFMFGPLRSKTMGFRLVVGVVMGFAFYILNEFLGSLSLVHALPPFLAAWLPLWLFMGVGLAIMRRTR